MTSQRHADAAALIDAVRSTGYILQTAKPFGEGRTPCRPARTTVCPSAAATRARTRCRPPQQLALVCLVVAELAIGNVVRRVLHIIREEAQNEALANAEAEVGHRQRVRTLAPARQQRRRRAATVLYVLTDTRGIWCLVVRRRRPHLSQQAAQQRWRLRDKNSAKHRWLTHTHTHTHTQTHTHTRRQA